MKKIYMYTISFVFLLAALVCSALSTSPAESAPILPEIPTATTIENKDVIIPLDDATHFGDQPQIQPLPSDQTVLYPQQQYETNNLLAALSIVYASLSGIFFGIARYF